MSALSPNPALLPVYASLLHPYPTTHPRLPAFPAVVMASLAALVAWVEWTPMQRITASNVVDACAFFLDSADCRMQALEVLKQVRGGQGMEFYRARDGDEGSDGGA